METIAGLRRPDSGVVRVAGLDPIADAGRVKEVLGVQLQESRFPDRLRVAEALELFTSFYDEPAPWPDLMEELGLKEQGNTPFQKLSGGQRQRLSIAVALLGRPEVAILDELTTGLDPNARRQTWSLIERLKERGVTIVLVTHFMEEAERLADRLALVGLSCGCLACCENARRRIHWPSWSTSISRCYILVVLEVWSWRRTRV